jgi:uncharacterized membrane protein
MYPESTRDYESNKILGGVGALLTAIGSLVLFRGAVGIVGVVGVILVLISIRVLADDLKDYSTYRRAITGFVFGIIGIIVAVAVLLHSDSSRVSSFFTLFWVRLAILSQLELGSLCSSSYYCKEYSLNKPSMHLHPDLDKGSSEQAGSCYS